MINILIYTDNVQEWFEKISENIKPERASLSRTNTFVLNNLIRFDIVSYIKENIRGKKYHLAVIDKQINDQEMFYLKYSIIQKLIYTDYTKQLRIEL